MNRSDAPVLHMANPERVLGTEGTLESLDSDFANEGRFGARGKARAPESAPLRRPVSNLGIDVGPRLPMGVLQADHEVYARAAGMGPKPVRPPGRPAPRPPGREGR